MQGPALHRYGLLGQTHRCSAPFVWRAGVPPGILNARWLKKRTSAQAAPADSVVEETVCVGTSPYEFGFKAEQGLREGMEDEVVVAWDSTGGYLYAGCYDGHGGPAAASWLKTELHAAVHTALQQHGHTTEALTAAFTEADAALLQHLEELGGEQLAQAGSTATVAVVSPNRVMVANVGDSQAFLMRKGVPVPLITPHRVYGSGPEVEGEVKRIKATGGWVYDGRVCNILAVSRAFGDWEFKGKGLVQLLEAGIQRGYWPAAFAAKQSFLSDPVVVTPATLDTHLTKEDEFLVVSTDGLWDVMPPRDAMQWARKELLKGARPTQVAESLVDLALKRHTSDNTSVVVIDLQGPAYWAAKGGKSAGKGLFGGWWGR
uniref:TAP38 n=1 Tax=Haematococcus lacustris TaxID=44745 RepID=A0A2I6B3M9_HAELA|nr:TAP38 [Haematococcus lacustris]